MMNISKCSVSLLLLLLFKINFIAGEIDDVDETREVNLGGKGKTFDETKQYLKDELKKFNLVPGKNVRLLIEPPNDWNFNVTKNIVILLENEVRNFVDTPDASFEIIATEDEATGSLVKIELKLSIGFLLSSRAEKIFKEKNETKQISLNISSSKDFMFKLKEVLNETSSLISEITNDESSHKWININLKTQKGDSNMIQEFVAILKRQLCGEIGSSHDVTINPNVLQDKEKALKRIDLYLEIYPITRKKQLKIELMSGIDPERVLKRLLMKFVSIDPHNSCPPMNLLVTTQDSDKKEVFKNLKNIIKKFLVIMIPDKQFSVKYNEVETNSDNNKFNISIEYDNLRIETSRSNDFGLVVDLSYLQYFMSHSLKFALNGIMSEVRNELRYKKFKHLTFHLKLLPWQREYDLSLLRNEILLALMKQFSDCRILVSITPLVGPYGFYSHIKFDVFAERKNVDSRGNELEMLIDPNRENINIVSQLRMLIINNLPKIYNDLAIKHSASLIFKVPLITNPGNYLIKVENQLNDQLKVYFPFYDIRLTSKKVGGYNYFKAELKLKYKDPQRDISIQEALNIHLNNSGVSLENDLRFALEQKILQWKNLMDYGKPITLNLIIELPQFLSNRFTSISAKLVPIIKQFFPDSSMDITANRGLGDLIMVSVVLRKKNSSKTFTINVRNLDLDLDEKIISVLSKLLTNTQTHSKDPKSQYFQLELESQPYSISEFKTKILNPIRTSLNNICPNSLISIIAEIKPSISKTDLTIIVATGLKIPRKRYELTMDVNLRRLIPQLEHFLNRKEIEAKNDLSNGRSVGLTFVLKTSPITELLDLEIARTYILLDLIQHIPNHKIYTGLTYLKDSRNRFKYAEIDVVIQSSAESKDSENVPPPQIGIDFSDDKNSTFNLPEEFIYNLITVIGNDPKNTSSHKVEINIKVPPKSNENSLFFISSRVVDEISKYFPEFFIDSISNIVKTISGFKKISLFLHLTPGKLPESGFTRDSPRIFQVVIPNAKENLAIQFLKWFELNSGKLYVELHKKPVIIVVNINPPDMSKRDYEMKKLMEIKKLISNLFDSYNLRFEVRAIEDQRGYLTSMDILIQIKRKDLNSIDGKYPTILPSTAIGNVVSDEVEERPSDEEEPGYPVLTRTTEIPGWPDIIGDGWDGNVSPATTPKNIWNPFPPLWDGKISSTTETSRTSFDFGFLWNVTSSTNVSISEGPVKPDNGDNHKVAIKIQDSITSIFEPFYLIHMFDILEKLQKKKKYYAEVIVEPAAEKLGKPTEILKIIRYIFDRFIGKGKLNLDLDDSSDKLKVKLTVEPSDQEGIKIDLDNEEKNNALNKIRQIVSKFLINFVSTLKNDEKSGILLEIIQPERPDFIVEVVKILKEIISEKYSNIQANFDVYPTDSLEFKIDMQLQKLENTMKTDKPVSLQLEIIPDDRSFMDLIKIKLKKFIPIISAFMKNKEKLTLVMVMDIPPVGANRYSVFNIVEMVRTYVEEQIPTASLSIRPFWSETHANRMKLEIQVQELPERATSSSLIFTVDLSNLNRTINSYLKEITEHMIPKVKKELNDKKLAVIRVTIQPPEKSKESFMYVVRDVIIPSLTSPFCGYTKKSISKFNVNLYGFLDKVTITIVLEPSKNAALEDGQFCEENITFDPVLSSTTESSGWPDISRGWGGKVSPGTTASDNEDNNEFEVVVKPQDDITTMFEPFYLQYMFDILDKLQNEKKFAAHFIVEPTSGNLEKPTDILKIIHYLFDRLIGKGKVKLDLDDSSDKLIIHFNVEPSYQKVIQFNLKNEGKNNALNKIRQIVSKLLINFVSTLKEEEKSGILLDIIQPEHSRPDFIVEVVKILKEILSENYSNINAIFDVYPTDSLKFKIDMQFLKSENTMKTDKLISIQVKIVPDDMSVMDLIKKELEPIIPIMSAFIKNQEKLTLVMDMEIPAEATNYNSIVDIKEMVRTYVEEKIPTASISIRPYWSQTHANRMKLEVLVQKVPERVTSSTIQLTVDLSNPNRTMNSYLQKLIERMTPSVENKLNDKKPAIITITIQPPEKSKESFMSVVHDVIIPSLTSPFCGYTKKSVSKFDVDLYGFLDKVTITIALEPSKNAAPQNDQFCEEYIRLDFSKPTTDLNAEIDKNFQPIAKEVQVYLEKRKTVNLNFEARLSSPPTDDFLEKITKSLYAILQNYFPHNGASLKIRAKTSREGSFLSIKITILPEENPLPQSDLDIPMDLSQGISIKLFVKHVVETYRQQMAALINSRKQVVLKIRITPKKGADDSYFDEITDDLLKIIHELFEYKTIKMQSKAAKNSKGEIFHIVTAITLS